MSEASAKAGPLDASVIPTRIANGVCVSIGIVADVDGWVLKSLKDGSPLYSSSHVDSTCVLYTMYELVKNKLMGSTTDAIKNKINAVNCGAVGGEFVISIIGVPNGSSVRKALGITLKNISPHKLYAKYTSNIRLVGEKPDKDAFLAAASKILDQLKSKISIVIMGKIKLDKAKLEEILEKVQKKLALGDVEGKGAKRQSKAETKDLSSMSSVNAPKGIACVLLKEFLESSLGPVELVDGKLWLPSRLESKAHAMADEGRVTAHVKKLMKLKKDATPAALYVAALECVMGTREIKSEAEGSHSEGSLVKSLVAALK